MLPFETVEIEEREREMSAWMITRNSDDRQLKPEVAVFLDWSMMNDSYNCPSSSARENEEEEEERERMNQSSFHSRVKKPGVIFNLHTKT